MATEIALSTCLYGDPKTGKTIAVEYVAWDGACCGPKDSAVQLTAQAMLGIQLPFAQVMLLSQIVGVAAEAKRRGFKKLFVDDLSHIAANTELWHKAQPYGGNNFKVYGGVRADMQNMVYQVCNVLGMTIFFTAHEKPAQPADPSMNKKAMRGGPKLPSGFQEDLPSYMDCVYRVQHSSNSPRGMIKYGWPHVLRSAGGDTEYAAGDRLNVAPDCANINLGEIYRAYNGGAIAHQFQRPPPWQSWIEGAVAHFAPMMAEKENDLSALEKIQRALIEAGQKVFPNNPRPIWWALNDSQARAYLMKHSREADPFAAFLGMGNLCSVPVPAAAAPVSMDSNAPAAPAAAAPTTTIKL